MYSGPTLGLGHGFSELVAHLQRSTPNHESGKMSVIQHFGNQRTLIQEREAGLGATPLVPFPRQFTHSTGPIALEVNFRAPCPTEFFCLTFQGPEVVEGPVGHENILRANCTEKAGQKRCVCVPGACLFPIQLSTQKGEKGL